MGIKSSIFRSLVGMKNLVLSRQLTLWVWHSVESSGVGRREVWCHGSQENSISCVFNAVNKSRNLRADTSLTSALRNMGVVCGPRVPADWGPQVLCWSECGKKVGMMDFTPQRLCKQSPLSISLSSALINALLFIT